jgi:hypothetical protein
LDPLETIKTAGADDDEEGIPVITDMDFNEDCLVSICGYLLPRHRPWNLFVKHENERMRARQEEEAKEAEKQLIRNKPLKEKWFRLLELAKENPNEALVYLTEGLKNRVLMIPTKLRATDQTLLLNLLKTKTIQGTRGLVHLLRHPSELILIPKYLVNGLYLKLFPPSQEEVALENMIKEMTEKERKEETAGGPRVGEGVTGVQQGRRKGLGKVVMQDMTPVPVTHPDAVLMKIVLLHDPPPVFEMVPPPKWYDPAMQLKNDLSDFLAEVSGTRKKKSKEGGKRKQPKYHGSRMRLPFYASSLSNKQSLDHQQQPLSRHSEVIVSSVVRSGMGDHATEGPNPPPNEEPKRVEEARDDQGPDSADERSHFSGSTLTTKPPDEPHPLSPNTSSGPLPATTARSKRRTANPSPPQPHSTNALGKYQLGSLTQRLYHNYKDSLSGAAPTVIEKEIFDNSRRRLFEEQLIQELSTAACIPTRFFSIEEIRRFPENDPKLSEMKKKREDYFLEEERLVQEKKRKELEEYQATQELIKRSQLLSRQRQEEKRNLTADMVLGGADESDRGPPVEGSVLHSPSTGQGEKTPDEIKSINPSAREGQGQVSRDAEEEEEDEEEEDLDKLIGETDEARRARLKASARKQSIWADGLAHPHPLNLGLHPIDSIVESPSVHESNLHSPDALSLHSPESPHRDHFSVSLASPPKATLHGQVINLQPSQLAPVDNFKLGLPNPEDEIHDPRCWLANELRELTEEERQLKRFKYLQIQHAQDQTKLQILQEELIKIKRKQQELLSICQEFVQPRYQELNRQINPMKEELVRKIGEYLKRLREKKRPTEKYQEAGGKEMPTGIDGNELPRPAATEPRAESDEGINEQMVMRVHQQLMHEEQSMLSDLALAQMESNPPPEIKEGTVVETRTQAFPLSTDGNELDDAIAREVKATLRQMSLAIEYHHYLYHQPPSLVTPPGLVQPTTTPSTPHALSTYSPQTDIYDEYLELCDEERSSSQPSPLKGCEVSLIIHVDNSLKQHIYLRDLHSDDISAFLTRQLNHKHSKLLTGQLTSGIVDIQHKLLFHKRVNFNTWEDLWVHFISPVFFRYTIKPSRVDRYNGGQSHGRLSGGLIVVNPLDSFTSQQKVTYTRLPQPLPDSEGGAGLDYNCDEIGKELSANSSLTVYRPNMSTLTQYDVLKCKRIMQIFHERYLNEMKYGLADGTRLRYGQYLALKDFKSSQRVYELVKQKKARDDRGGGEGSAGEEGHVITKISPEIFNGWMKEAKDEEERELKETRKQALKLKEIRRQEAEMRRKYDAQKTWFYGKIFQHNAPIAGELASHVKDLIEEQEEMIARGGSATATSQERTLADDHRREMKITSLQEERQTRVGWETLCRCHLDHVAANQEDEVDIIEEALTNPSGVRTPRKSKTPESLPLEGVLHTLNLIKIRKEVDDKHRKFLEKREIKEKERAKREKRRLQQERALKLQQAHELAPASPAPPSLAPKSQLATEEEPEHDLDSVSLVSQNPNPLPEPAEDADGYSMMSEPLKKFTVQVQDAPSLPPIPSHLLSFPRCPSQDMELFNQLSWARNIFNHNDILECLRKFPTTVPGLISR